MSNERLDEEYEQLPEWLRDTLDEIYDYGINHGGHIWVAFRDIEKAIVDNYEEQEYHEPDRCDGNIKSV